MAKLTTESAWATHPLPEYAAIDEHLSVDVVVVGGGLTGLTTAYLLQREGVRVALFERDRLASGETARTTAHLTYVTDRRLHLLVEQLGKDGARAFWEAGRTAIAQIADIARQLEVDCDFRHCDGFLHAPDDSGAELDKLQLDAALARELGFDAHFESKVPYAKMPGVCFRQQGQFHPRAYLDDLARRFRSQGGLIFENSAIEQVTETPFSVRANGATVKCDYLVLATHNPLMGQKGAVSSTLFQTKLALYTSYVLGARLGSDAAAPVLLWDTNDPYYYLRIKGDRYAIFGGGDVKTGQETDIPGIYAELEKRLLTLLPSAQVDRRWLGQVIETDDGLPFIGENASHQFIATGFSGNGMTLGTVAAMMARDRFLHRANPWSDLFRVDRSPFHGGAWQYASENMDYPFYVIRDRLRRTSNQPVESLRNGEGSILMHEGNRVAAFRNDQGELTLCSPVCTHMKCLVRWNGPDQTWDCPCHGSRFRATGEVLGGPAESPLQKL